MMTVCGITGWVDWEHDVSQENKTLIKMAATLSKRGPDALNVWSRTHAGFGHARLAVVDLEGGAQPMTRGAGNAACTLCYNGELYNTEDLRKELLKKGYRFEGHSDTEVLLVSYLEWGESCIDHFNGIFAFAIWDSKKEKVFLARDRLGVKPLFYSIAGGRLLFGSELKAILAHPEIKAELEREGLQEVLGLGPSRTPGHGVFKGISELRPGHALTFDRNGKTLWRYWNVKSECHSHTLDETVANVRGLVVDAVQRQLVADVPVCTFLSGGLDSSVISAIAAEHFKTEKRGPLHTFSIDYVDNDKYFQASDFQPNADGPYIQKMVEATGSVHHSCVIDTELLVNHLREAVTVRDLPGMADVDSSLIWFCRLIKEQSTVALSGECADEIFGGYPWFHKPEVMNRPLFPWMSSTEEREDLLHDHWKNKLNLSSYVKQRYHESLAEMPRLDGESGMEAKRREIFYLNMIWFMTTLLDRKDRMSMGASLEVRVPFADHRIVEYAWNIPWEMKMLEGREKGLLRKALTGILPHEVLYRKKSPYPKTHNPNYTQSVKEWLQSIVDKKSSPILELMKKNKVQEIIDTNGEAFKVPWFGQLMTGPQLMAHLSQIDTWLKDYKINIVD
ncbi:asparagine synthase (glutamine-hydrolyzing) [Fictibacillus terranigra]|uniref:asparagine synthase (glutamine-hydrolyzing) n=1 Tax=Fictibacillus terranigra TaxID=3058424 RepID=A0ABT8E766_9BACL|nr:asparagine synthase (glutamine-hydrolyzing) [Fictibacillus sp. CENA-BCM004]MDN4073747.1 asparagine synthase (glutamine-hydrolyzing) [Fictibacillus sp. CENA-BCM004]